jgi:hypothetical protein
MKKKKKVYYVIDSTLIALAVRLLTYNDNNLYLVVEKKNLIDDRLDVIRFTELLFNGTVYSVENALIPSHYFLTRGASFVRSLILMRRYKSKLNKIFSVEKDAIYIGPRTSGIMMCVPASQRLFIDHGTGEYGERAHQITNGISMIKLARRFLASLLYSIFNAANSLDWRPRPGIRMCQLSDSQASFLDYRNIKIPDELANILQFKDISTRGGVILYLPTSEPHTPHGIPSDALSFDKLNLEIIMNNSLETDLVVIKFHPSLYLTQTNVETKLVNLLSERGRRSVIFDELLPVEWRGIIPSELLIKALGIRTLVMGEESSTGFNVCHNEDIDIIYHLTQDSVTDQQKMLRSAFLSTLNATKYASNILIKYFPNY